ncbi:MAG: carboxypeptidase-like regulatory domain-containing protein, partial [Planctomycetaceae bacterium]
YKTADLWHQRIWNQIARSVMARSFSVSSEFLSLDTGPVSYQPGQAVDVRIRLQDASGKPAVAATVDALVWRGGQVAATVSLQSDENVPGIYRGRVTGLPAGDYEVSVQAAGYSAEALQARSSFTVTAELGTELRDGSANESLLQQMAEAGGGQFLREEDLRRLPEILSVYSNGRIVQSDSLLWQSYWWFLSILLLLTCEWLLRRRAGLM